MKEYEREENITIINRQIWKVTYNKARKKKVIPRYKFFKTKNYIYHINLMIQMSTVRNKKEMYSSKYFQIYGRSSAIVIRSSLI